MLLLQGNCLELMHEIPDTSIDMILCDLPYGTTNCSWDSVIPFDPLWEQYKRVIRGSGAIVLTASQPFTSALVMSNIGWFKYQWVWKKNRATGHVHAKNKPMKIHEDVCVFSSGVTLHQGQSENRMAYYPQGLTELPPGTKRRTRNDAGDNSVMAKRKSHKETLCTHTGYPLSVIEFPVDVNNGKRVHPTQKPLSLMEYLILTYTNKGDTVLDNCMGSGTTGVACVNTMRDFVGMELDQKYFQIASDRINQALMLVEGNADAE
ncbi:TPA: site-specific DNA-methyltransferase [Yersinia enterocolitica]|uniref:DNA-methyltransferase n=1 Tax=Yersinia enterocolitica TaxID=630 RepID=UPI002A3F464B|nr:site-specific DNA-methyltransferase [Yersinia enterocolitica]HEK5864145.1 site-specific DNA-methyltransferase [Yersinia enterocolitica]HEN3530449.1 site-specific DNA-methyltransferase [Yersinia enterocolitica]HEN3597922.1 site-specific DNA-methyltransferase [Yersinia enterocolitica]HEP1961808.1 site-specific DNA-methyltransferase [Yersinia enterocolitica]